MCELYDSDVVINQLNLRGKPDCISGVDGYYVCYEVKAIAVVMSYTYVCDLWSVHNTWCISILRYGLCIIMMHL